MQELGKGYGVSTLKDMRRFYLFIQKSHTLYGQLNWNHYKELFKLKSAKEIEYYVYITEKQNLSVRELRERIKSKEYERIGFKEELKEPKVNTLIKNPIIIRNNNKNEKLTEYALHQLILENIESFLNELGIEFMFASSEYKIKIGDRYNYIDFLLYNIKFNCYVVIELKVTEIKAEYIGQIKKYMNYIDKHIKEPFNDKTIGIIICKKENRYVMEYCSDEKIFTTSYEIV